MSQKLTRREALGILGAAGAAVSAACAGDTPTSASAITDASAGGTASGACVVTPTETIGPYPSLIDLVRSDIREGRPGAPMTLTLTVVNTNAGCTPMANAVVDVWQCDAEGRYSEYNQAGYDGRSETFLRGIQTTGANGQVAFTTVYPGWYAGRATHIHVEVSVNGRSVKVTQIAFPESINAAVYGSSVYAARGQNPTSNSRDMVFSDGVSSELATVTGSPAGGYAATFTVGVAV